MTPAVKAIALLMAASIARHASTPDVSSHASPRIHTVRAGETLWTIAAARVGDGSRWPALYRANRDQIRDPSLLHPGQRLEIPSLAATGADEADAARPAAPANRL